ncbi:sigma factor, partial [Acinetobacter baumannii]
PTDADDLCQAAVERALKARDQWQPGTRMDSWMYRIMRNSWIDTTRARARQAETFVDEEAGAAVGDRGDQAIEATVELGNVGRAMQK